MPFIKKVDIASQPIVQGNPGIQNFDVTVTAVIKFSEVERNIGLSYNARIALYEIDEKMDVFSVFPNNHQLFLQHASRGDSDDFIGFSNLKAISARSNEATIKHIFSVRASSESDGKMELKALVVCVPDTATAMKWSPMKKVQVITG